MSKAWAGGSTTAWRKLRAAVLLRDGGVCQIRLPGCTDTATHACHITPKSAGGGDVLTNLRAGCPDCNYAEGDSIGDPDPRPVTQW